MATGTIQKPNDKVLSRTFPAWGMVGMCNVDGNSIRFVVQAPTLAVGTYTAPASFGAQISHADSKFTDATFTVSNVTRPANSDCIFITTNRPSGVQSESSGIFRFKTNITISASQIAE